MKVAYESIMKRVDDGIKLLDIERGEWRNKVHANQLDAASVRNCTLGQVFESFLAGLDSLGIALADCDTPVSFGFEAANSALDGSNEDLYTEYKDLTNEWKRRLSGSY